MEIHILVVDDEKEIADLIELYLMSEEFMVHKFYSGVEALQFAQQNPPDLAILDLMLPDLDGMSICRKLREEYTFPIIMLTAKSEETDKISGLLMGADDYITKPFRPLELIARVKAQLRRYTTYNKDAQEKNQNWIQVRGLMLNKDTHECWLNEKPLYLTPTEFSILWVLCENQGKVVSSEQLFFKVWGEKYFKSSNNTVMVHIRHIREKMKDTADHPKYIKTVWGVGYKIDRN